MAAEVVLYTHGHTSAFPSTYMHLYIEKQTHRSTHKGNMEF